MYISVCYSDQESAASGEDRPEGVGGRCQAQENLGQTRVLQKGDVQGQHCSHMKDMSNMHVCTCANDKLSHVLTAYGRVVVTVCSCMLRQRYSPTQPCQEKFPWQTSRQTSKGSQTCL